MKLDNKYAKKINVKVKHALLLNFNKRVVNLFLIKNKMHKERAKQIVKIIPWSFKSKTYLKIVYHFTETICWVSCEQAKILSIDHKVIQLYGHFVKTTNVRFREKKEYKSLNTPFCSNCFIWKNSFYLTSYIQVQTAIIYIASNKQSLSTQYVKLMLRVHILAIDTRPMWERMVNVILLLSAVLLFGLSF